MRISEKLRFAVPLDRLDFITGQVDAFARAIERTQLLPSIDARQATAVALGYGTWEKLQRQEAQCATTAAEYPDRAVGMVDCMAWRLGEHGASCLADAECAVRSAWDSANLTARTYYGPYGQKEYSSAGRNEDDLPWIDLSDVPCAPHRHPTLFNGRIFIPNRLQSAVDIYAELGPHGTQIPRDVLMRLFDEACVDIERAMRILYPHYRNLAPPGFSAASLRGASGEVVGHALNWDEVGAWMKDPVGSSDDLLEIMIRLWRRQDVSWTGLTAASLPNAVFAEDFMHPLQTERTSVPFDEVTQAHIDAESSDVEEADLEALPVARGRISLGVDFEFRGIGLTRAAIGASEAEICEFMELPAISEDAEIDWLRAKIPFALTEQEYEIVCRTTHTLSARGRQVEERLRRNPREAVALAALTAKGARPVRSQISEAWMQGTLGAVEYTDIPHADAAARRTYPELASLPEEALGEYALSFYGKNGIRHDRRQEKFDPQFVAYVVLRNLALDPLPGLTPYYGYWQAVYDIVREHVKRRESTLQDSKLRADFEFELRKWLAAVSSTVSVIDQLDTSVDSSALEHFAVVDSKANAAA